MVDKAIYHCPKPIAVFCRSVVKLVNGNQGIIKCAGTAHPFKGKAQGGMCAQQVFGSRVVQKRQQFIYFACFSGSTQVVAGINMPVCKKTEFA